MHGSKERTAFTISSGLSATFTRVSIIASAEGGMDSLDGAIEVVEAGDDGDE